MHWIFYTFFVEFVVEIWWSTSFEKIATLHTATSLTLNYITDIFLQILQSAQSRCRYNIFKNRSFC